MSKCGGRGIHLGAAFIPRQCTAGTGPCRPGKPFFLTFCCCVVPLLSPEGLHRQSWAICGVSPTRKPGTGIRFFFSNRCLYQWFSPPMASYSLALEKRAQARTPIPDLLTLCNNSCIIERGKTKSQSRKRAFGFACHRFPVGVQMPVDAATQGAFVPRQ